MEPIRDLPAELRGLHRLGANRKKQDAIGDKVAQQGYKFAADIDPGDWVLIPVQVVKVAVTIDGKVELTIRDIDGKDSPATLLYDEDETPVRTN